MQFFSFVSGANYSTKKARNLQKKAWECFISKKLMEAKPNYWFELKRTWATFYSIFWWMIKWTSISAKITYSLVVFLIHPFQVLWILNCAKTSWNHFSPKNLYWPRLLNSLIASHKSIYIFKISFHIMYKKSHKILLSTFFSDFCLLYPFQKSNVMMKLLKILLRHFQNFRITRRPSYYAGQSKRCSHGWSTRRKT